MIGLPIAQLQIEKPGGSDDCVASNGFCPEWIADNIDRYWTPLLEHVYLTVAPVAIGFVLSMGLAILAHRRRWLTGPIIGVTGALYTVPSVAAFFLECLGQRRVEHGHPGADCVEVRKLRDGRRLPHRQRPVPRRAHQVVVTVVPGHGWIRPRAVQRVGERLARQSLTRAREQAHRHCHQRRHR